MPMAYHRIPDIALLPLFLLESDHDHGLTCAEWADLLRQFSPWQSRNRDCYGEPPPSTTPNRCTLPGTEERVKVYARRFANCESLWHEDDLRVTQLDAAVAMEIARNRNGSDRPGDFRAEREAA
jgi:hypothetical protein